MDLKLIKEKLTFKEFPASTKIKAAYCECGNELKFLKLDFNKPRNEAYLHICESCNKEFYLERTYPQIFYYWKEED
jgi:hypothetical protein